MPDCAREKLQQLYHEYLAQNYSDLSIVDLELAAKQWVIERGSFINGIGLAVCLKKCEKCGQYPYVVENGTIMNNQGSPSCEIAPRPVFVSINDFNKSP